MLDKQLFENMGFKVNSTPTHGDVAVKSIKEVFSIMVRFDATDQVYETSVWNKEFCIMLAKHGSGQLLATLTQMYTLIQLIQEK